MSKALDISNLLPDLEKLWIFIKNGEINFSAIDGEIFSASIVTIMLVIFVMSLGYTIFWGHFLAKFRIAILEQKLLFDLTPENLDQQKRRVLKERSAELKAHALKGYFGFYRILSLINKRTLEHVGKLWQEFDETLAESSKGKLYNTIDSIHFFNNHTLAPVLTENRLLAAVPSFLTAIGVIGTFAGLQMGLHGVSFEGDITAQQDDIKLVIASAAVAFLTSVWGVFFSVLFNFIEKALEQNVKKHISKLQNRIDFLFPRMNPAQSLIEIADSSSNSQNTLNGLAERIGDELQKAVSGMGEQVTAGIKQVMKPAMDSLVGASNKLADRQANSATDAFSQLLTQFMEKMSEAGVGQRQLMDDATSELKNSIATMHEQMKGFLKNVEKQTADTAAQAEERNKKSLEQFSNFSNEMSATVSENVEASKASTSRNEKLASELKELTEKLSNVMGGLDRYSERMIEASTNIEQASSEVRSATKVLENEISKAIGAVKDLTTENTVVIKNTQQIFDQIGELKGELEKTATSVNEASKTVANTFNDLNKHQTEFLKEQKNALQIYEESMKKEFTGLTESTERFLKNYTEMVKEQTNERLSEWNKQTDEFSRQMIEAVKYLQSVIEEVDNSKPEK